MIIVEQDEKTIINFDEVTKILITSPIGTNDGEFKITAENILTAEILGYYKTEERAKEVLEDIMEFYVITEERNKVYRMPKE